MLILSVDSGSFTDSSYLLACNVSLLAAFIHYVTFLSFFSAFFSVITIYVTVVEIHSNIGSQLI